MSKLAKQLGLPKLPTALSPRRVLGALEFPLRAPSTPKGVAPKPRARTTGGNYDTSWARKKPARMARAAIVEGPMRLMVAGLAAPERKGTDRLLDLPDGPLIFAANHHSHLDTPLMLTSILCEALMVWMGIGVKVATLPVIALGVGIGVDYALYVLTVILAKEKEGKDLTTAYYETLNFTGKVVALIGVTLAAGVITWAMSPIKFQADMGILLTFMFIWNMFGALILMPALACFLIKPKPQPETDG